MSYSDDSSTGEVSGSQKTVLSNITKQTEEMQVKCCVDGELINKTCGNGTSCENICGENRAGRICLSKLLFTYSFRQGESFEHRICT